MPERIAVAYIPVLHEGYRRFIERHATGGRLLLIPSDFVVGYRPLQKDVRVIDARLLAASIAAWGICHEVAVLTASLAVELAEQAHEFVLPDEDVSRMVVESYFSRKPVMYDSVFLRWDRRNTVLLREPKPHRNIELDGLNADLMNGAFEQGDLSSDWWRQVGAILRLADGQIIRAFNQALDPLAPYRDGDPRANFFKGVHLELGLTVHAESRVIGAAARLGLVTAGAALYVTDFPCPPCAKLLVMAGIAQLYYADGYAVLDGQAVLDDANVEIIQVSVR
jgi:dCMP deaminase